jgi:glycerophosphoryl diester phosphodiesterase
LSAPPTWRTSSRFVEDKAGGASVKRWYVNDFTLAEIKQLDAGSWMDRKFAGTRILTFQEAIDLVRGKAGLYPELKDPEFYRQRGVNPEKLFADIVKKNRLEAAPRTPDGLTRRTG